MAKRRENNEGSITQLKNGKYKARIQIGRNDEGKRVYKTKMAKTKKECVEWLEKIKREKHLGVCVKPDQIKVGEWLLYWLEYYKKVKIKPSTYDRYEASIKNNINPSIGNIMIQKLTTRDVQAMYNKMLDDGYVPSAVHKVHNVLKPALRQAQIEGVVGKNVAEFVSLPSKQKSDIVVFSKEEQKLFLETAKDYNTYEAFVVNLNTGLRMCEILALTWDDIDFKNKQLCVNKNYVRVKDRKESNTKSTHVVQNSTKTTRGTRTVPLTNEALTVLKQLKLKNQSKTNIVFCSTNHKHISPRNYERAFQRVLKRANLKTCNTHTMRHTFATRLFEANVPAKTISELLGHASVSFTLDTYVTVLPDTKKDAIHALEKALLG